MTPAEIAAARVIIEAATPGPWAVGQPQWSRHLGPGSGPGPFNIWVAAEDLHGVDVTGPHAHLHESDAAFIAAARTGWPAALDEVERLRADSFLLRSAERMNRHGYEHRLESARLEGSGPIAAEMRRLGAIANGLLLRLEQKNDALARYGKHEPGCALTGWRGRPPADAACSCGLDAALAPRAPEGG